MWAWVMTISWMSLDAVARAFQGLLEVAHRAAVVHARVHEHDAVAGLEGPGVDVGDARQVEGEAEPPHTGQHALAPALLARSGRLTHGQDATVEAHGEEVPPEGARVLVRRPGRFRARAARLDDPRDAAPVRRGREREHPLARGRMAPGGRVPVRAARRALGDRGDAADRQAEGAARAVPLRLRRTSGRGFAACCASTWPNTSRRCRRHERGWICSAADGLLPRGDSGPAGARPVVARWPRRCCWRCSGRSWSARPGR